MLESITDERLNMEPAKQPTVEVQELEVKEVKVEKYVTPQPNIPRGTRLRNPKIAKNMRNKPCGCGSGVKFKKCCGPNIGSEQLYVVPSAQR